MRVLAGTSGFAYAEWKGSFYPDDLPNDAMLSYYAERFGTVEINNTFYRMPSDAVLAAWAAQVPDGFRFVLKANRQITHFKRLGAESLEPLRYFCARAATLGGRLGPVLFQLPPHLKKDAARLEAFLAAVPAEIRPALEFRHESWLDGEIEELLRARDAALVIAHSEEGETPFTATASWGYLRLRNVAYGPGELESWSRRVAAQDWSETFVFFKHEEKGTGPALARRFAELPR